MAVLAKIFTEVDALVNNTLAPLFFDETEILFLKESETADEFDTVYTLDDSWWREKFDNFNENFLLEVARNDDDFNDEVIAATHVQIGDDVYVISKGKTLPPSGTQSSWSFFCERFTKKSQFSNIS